MNTSQLITVPNHIQQKYEQIKKNITEDWDNEITQTEKSSLSWEEKRRKISRCLTQSASSVVHLEVAVECVAKGMTSEEVETYTTSPEFVWDQYEVLNYFSDLTKV